MRRLAVLPLFLSVYWCTLLAAAIFGQSRPQAGALQPSGSEAASQSSPTQPISMAKTPAKVWTNDDIDVLGHNHSVSVASTHTATKNVSTSAKALPSEKNPAWYRQQLIPLRAEIDKLDSQIAKLKAFLSGENVSEPPTMHHQLVPTPQDQLKQMEAKREAAETKMDDLLDRARHNGIEPGALR